MPVRMTPDPDEPIGSRDVRPEEWATEGPYEEHISIRVFLRDETRQDALKAARRTVVAVGPPQEEIDNNTYLFTLFKAQVTGWRLLDPDGTEIPFNEENLRKLPWDLRSWLHDRIIECGGILPTSDLVTRTKGGKPLTYFRPQEGVAAEPLQRGDDPERNAVLGEGVVGHSHA